MDGQRQTLIGRRLELAWALPLWLGVRAAGAVPVMRQDVARWISHFDDPSLDERSEYGRFARLARERREFRSVVHYRLKSAPLPVRKVLAVSHPGLRTLHLWTADIGPGLVIDDGSGSIIGAESIGANCLIAAEVSVGFTAKGTPVVGDDVSFGAGAKVVGPISVGDGAVIGPNAVVVSDVSPNTELQVPLPLEEVKR